MEESCAVQLEFMCLPQLCKDVDGGCMPPFLPWSKQGISTHNLKALTLLLRAH